MTKTKSEIRKEIKSLFKEKLCDSVEKQKLQSESEQICKKIISSKEYLEADILMAFMPMSDEVNILSVLNQALYDNKKLTIPKIIPETSFMDFYYINQSQLQNQLKPGSYGIFEPDETFVKLNFSDLINLKQKTNILMLVPGLAFTSNGNRLGRGKGFYDIFLEGLENEVVKTNPNIQFKKIGICYNFQVLPQIPTSENDMNIDSIIF